jgi:hypothetical protein
VQVDEENPEVRVQLPTDDLIQQWLPTPAPAHHSPAADPPADTAAKGRSKGKAASASAPVPPPAPAEPPPIEFYELGFQMPRNMLVAEIGDSSSTRARAAEELKSRYREMDAVMVQTSFFALASGFSVAQDMPEESPLLVGTGNDLACDAVP